MTKAKEIPLVCPDNRIGHVDLYLVNHHGMNLSSSEGVCVGDCAAGGDHEQRRAQGR